MKELKDIVLKKGDRVYCKGVLSGNEVICIITSDEAYTNNFFSDITKVERSDITKVERPIQYETIYEAPKQVLDKKEKEYLEAIIRPFKDKEVYIEKWHNDFYGQYIKIQVKNYMDEDESINLPYFEKNKMYKGMELDKEYTLDELGLFKE